MLRATQTTIIAAAIAFPAVLAAIGVTAIEGYRIVTPDAPLFGSAPASLGDAIMDGDGVEYAYRFIRSGQDPNEPIAIDRREYTGGRSIRVPPLMLAIAARDENTTMMLLNVGARLDRPQHRWARCLAHEVGNQAVLAILARNGGEHLPPACPDRTAASSPALLRWLD